MGRGEDWADCVAAVRETVVAVVVAVVEAVVKAVVKALVEVSVEGAIAWPVSSSNISRAGE